MGTIYQISAAGGHLVGEYNGRLPATPCFLPCPRRFQLSNDGFAVERLDYLHRHFLAYRTLLVQIPLSIGRSTGDI